MRVKFVLTAVLVALLSITFMLTPSHYCGAHCGLKWWIALQQMSDIERMFLEASENCRDNPDLVVELNFTEICEQNFVTEKEILNRYYSPIQ